jgi:hypothetical protein
MTRVTSRSHFGSYPGGLKVHRRMRLSAYCAFSYYCMALWLASYPDGACRVTRRSAPGLCGGIGKKRIKLSLPAPAWLRTLLEAQGESPSALLATLGGSNLARDESVPLRCLVRVVAGATYIGPETNFGREAWALREYLRQPLDCYSVKIGDRYNVNESVSLTHSQSNKSGSGGIRRIELAHPLITPHWGFVDPSNVAGGIHVSNGSDREHTAEYILDAMGFE